MADQSAPGSRYRNYHSALSFRNQNPGFGVLKEKGTLFYAGLVIFTAVTFFFSMTRGLPLISGVIYFPILIVAVSLASQMLKKGKRVYVEGRLQSNSWEGNDGVKRNRTEIVAENFIPLTPKEGGFEPFESPSKTEDDSKKKPTKKEEKTESAEEINLDDIPF